MISFLTQTNHHRNQLPQYKLLRSQLIPEPQRKPGGVPSFAHYGIAQLRFGILGVSLCLFPTIPILPMPHPLIHSSFEPTDGGSLPKLEFSLLFPRDAGSVSLFFFSLSPSSGGNRFVNDFTQVSSSGPGLLCTRHSRICALCTPFFF